MVEQIETGQFAQCPDCQLIDSKNTRAEADVHRLLSLTTLFPKDPLILFFCVQAARFLYRPKTCP